MSSFWGFLWGAPWGSLTEWSAREDDTDPTSDLLELHVGDFDAIETALARLRRKFSTAASWQALARAIGGAFLDVELVMGQLEPHRTVGYADGVWLDEVGAIVNLPRSGWTTDAEYRLAIVAEALSRVTDGRAEELVDVAVRLVPDDVTIRYRERYPANFEIQAPGLPPGRFTLMLAIMADMPAAGVGGWLTTWDPDLTGGWSYTPSPPPDPAVWGYTGSPVGRSFWSYSRRLGT